MGRQPHLCCGIEALGGGGGCERKVEMSEEKVPAALSNCQSGKEQMNLKLKGDFFFSHHFEADLCPMRAKLQV